MKILMSFFAFLEVLASLTMLYTLCKTVMQGKGSKTPDMQLLLKQNKKECFACRKKIYFIYLQCNTTITFIYGKQWQQQRCHHCSTQITHLLL